MSLEVNSIELFFFWVGGSRETKLQNQNTKPSKTKELQDAAIKALSLRWGDAVSAVSPACLCHVKVSIPSQTTIPVTSREPAEETPLTH